MVFSQPHPAGLVVEARGKPGVLVSILYPVEQGECNIPGE